VEQLLRDCKITSIYEGTDGIQAIDLLGRKMNMHQGRLFERFIKEVRDTIMEARNDPALNTMANSLSAAMEKLEPLGRELARASRSDAKKGAFVCAHPFLKVTGDIIMAWMLLWRAHVASKALAAKPAAKDMEFYQGIIQTADYYIHSQLPVALGKIQGIQSQNSAPLDIADSCFG